MEEAPKDHFGHLEQMEVRSFQENGNGNDIKQSSIPLLSVPTQGLGHLKS